jgi:hypothetical protein
MERTMTDKIYRFILEGLRPLIMYLTCTIIVLLKKYNGMAYIFTLLMFRKPNKTTINKNKTINFIGHCPFHSRLYLDISRSFK